MKLLLYLAPDKNKPDLVTGPDGSPVLDPITVALIAEMRPAIIYFEVEPEEVFKPKMEREV